MQAAEKEGEEFSVLLLSQESSSMASMAITAVNADLCLTPLSGRVSEQDIV